MADPLKVKFGIAGFAIFILVIIPLLENKFFATVTIKRWNKVTWDDFQGIPQPFSSYEAGISSSIYLDYDSTQSRYIAYAGQNNIRSWAKRSREEQDYLLNHEQYHFNITELHARMLNDYIEENPEGTLQLYLLRLGSINIDLRKMQHQYDEETDHSLIYDKQRGWEFRIDSLLALQKGLLTDHFSGAQAYFTQPPDSSKGLIGVPYRSYAQYNYGMQLSLTSYQTFNIDYQTVTGNIRRNIENAHERLKAFSIDTTESFRVFSISQDTSNYTYYQLYIEKQPYLFQLKARFPNNTGDTTGYSQIASSFLNSFRVVDTDNYWIQKLEMSRDPINFYNISNKGDQENKDVQYCIVIGPSEQQGFFRGPFFREDGAMLLAYDYLIHLDTLHFKDVLLLNNDSYSHTPAPEGQIFFVPAKSIPKQRSTIKFGYLLLEDSVKECYQFHYETSEITPKTK